MLLLSTQLFGEKISARVLVRWIPFVDQLDDLGQFSWGSTTLAWLYMNLCQASNKNVVAIEGPLQFLQSWIFWRFSSLRPYRFDHFRWPLASRWERYLPTLDEKDSRVLQYQTKLDWLTHRDECCGGPGSRTIGRLFEVMVSGCEEVDDVLDNRRPDRRRMVSTRTIDRDWWWLDEMMGEDVAVPRRVRRIPKGGGCRGGRRAGRDGGRAPSAQPQGGPSSSRTYQAGPSHESEVVLDVINTLVGLLSEFYTLSNFVFNPTVVVDESKKTLITLHILFHTTTKYVKPSLLYNSMSNLHMNKIRGMVKLKQNLWHPATDSSYLWQNEHKSRNSMGCQEKVGSNVLCYHMGQMEM
ncbi:hypothetical protein PIB30_018602 [Stylosanthes scabra]|uniref:Aminotransferase-like plant mobile domain-containing protein n=1 Tax=Stylosanthes scabra TaxID=79078 RepID=A0ABU6S801_9FABA|nr:hypothetical protein [Stylosanthes scabra]